MTDAPAPNGPTPVSPTRYVPPAGRMDRWSGAAVRWLTAHGISVMGSRVLVVRGRTTGEPRSVPVNLLELDGERYLVAPRGNTQWVRNVRAAGTAELRLGSRGEEVRLTEVPGRGPGPGAAGLPEALGLGGRALRRGPERPLDRCRGRRGRAGDAGLPRHRGVTTAARAESGAETAAGAAT